MLTAIANNMFFDEDNPEYVHPEAMEKFLTRIITVDNLKILK